MIQEIQWAAEFYPFSDLETIYFGGGTPSLLPIEDIVALFNAIESRFGGKNLKEITFEANPEDLTLEKVQLLKAYTPISRFSIGIQSFFDEDLFFMNRAHNSFLAHQAIRNVFKAGYDNISMDLIYGSPTTTNDMWLENLQSFEAYRIPHLSAYCLTIEPQTALAHQIKTGQTPAPKDAHQVAQFDMLMDWAQANDYEHYEISNFCKTGYEAVHNSNYWNHKPYIGIGPSAHSFDGTNRYWNVASNAAYLKGWQQQQPTYEMEALSQTDLYNEFIMTGLRKGDGIYLEDIQQKFSSLTAHFLQEAATFIQSGHIIESYNQYFLSREGKKIADQISSALFWVSE